MISILYSLFLLGFQNFLFCKFLNVFILLPHLLELIKELLVYFTVNNLLLILILFIDFLKTYLFLWIILWVNCRSLCKIILIWNWISTLLLIFRKILFRISFEQVLLVVLKTNSLFTTLAKLLRTSLTLGLIFY